MKTSMNLHDCHNLTVNYSEFSEFLRPRSISELTLPPSIEYRLEKMIETKQLISMIFYGEPGNGKTTCARLLANRDYYDVYEINASLQNSIEIVRKNIEQFSTSLSLYNHKKVVILDEADFLSTSAQASLRSLIEKVTDNCKFIFVTNNLAKIHPAIQSRCYPICFDVTYDRLDSVIKKITSTIKSRLKESGNTIDHKYLQQIVSTRFPDYRAIAKAIEFELIPVV